jgi:hypothetical protein
MKRVNGRADELTRRMIGTVAGFGALHPEAVAGILGRDVRRVRGCMIEAEHAGWLVGGRRDLYAVSKPGVRVGRMPSAAWRGTCKVTAGNATHLRAISVAAAHVSGRYGCQLVGECATRRREFATGRSLGSAVMVGQGFHRQLPRLHRADFTATLGDGQLVAFEIECTRKSRRKLIAILEAWRRTDQVAYVVYAIPKAAWEVRRDVEQALLELEPEGQEKFVLVWLEELEYGVVKLDRIFR